MLGPTLSPLERSRIADAARLAAAGVPVKWRASGLRLVYVAGGREHLVLTAGSGRVFFALCGQVATEYSALVAPKTVEAACNEATQ